MRPPVAVTGTNAPSVRNRRNIDEILASQQQMMIRRGTLKQGGVGDDKMRDLMLRHLDQVFTWLDGLTTPFRGRPRRGIV